MEDPEKGRKAKSQKGGFCTSNRCIVLVLVVLIAAIAAVALVTFLAPGLRDTVVDEGEPMAPGLRDTVVDEGEPMVWWQTSIIYQIYPRSFQDTDGDGLGDLNGIISRLYYLYEINVGAIWISPFYKSPMKDFGYDVSNYTQVDPIFGNMADFERLVKEAHAKGIKVIVDFVPNHTSDQSTWFQRSKTGSDERYKDYYVWMSPKDGNVTNRQPPNSWQSIFGGSAWTWDDGRQQYYYHAFLPSQPDLNYTNPSVLQEIDDVLTFWLEKGVDGFRLDALPFLFESSNTSLVATKENPFEYMRYQEGTLDVVRRWKSLISDYERKTGKTIVLIAEATDITVEQRDNYFEAGTVPFFFDLLTAKKTCNATSACYTGIIRSSTNLKEGQWPTFVTGNHDNKRIADVNGPEYIDAMNMMLLTLPGTPTTYYGEELGMRDGNYTGMKPKDTFAITSNDWAKSRDPERNPMQWDGTLNAGFTNGTPWLPITTNTDYQHVNVKTELKSTSSHLGIYKRLAALRQSPAFQNANIVFPSVVSKGDVLIYVREDRTSRYLILINLSRNPQAVKLDQTSYKAQLVISTNPNKKTINLSYIYLQIGEGLVIELKRS